MSADTGNFSPRNRDRLPAYSSENGSTEVDGIASLAVQPFALPKNGSLALRAPDPAAQAGLFRRTLKQPSTLGASIHDARALMSRANDPPTRAVVPTLETKRKATISLAQVWVSVLFRFSSWSGFLAGSVAVPASATGESSANRSSVDDTPHLLL
jgi:hypothetical protein